MASKMRRKLTRKIQQGERRALSEKRQAERAVMDRRKEAVRAFKAGEMKSYEAIEVIRDCDKKLLAIRRGRSRA